MAKLFNILLLCFFCVANLTVDSANISDPTRPVFKVKKEKSNTITKAVEKKKKLSAIFIKNGDRKAIINNKLYKFGDHFAGQKIIAIKENSVELKGANGITRLTLIKPIKKRRKK